MNTPTGQAVYRLRTGSSPLLISIPHQGTHIPADTAATMTPTASFLDDTDWHLERLYDFADALGASVLTPLCSRYVIDLNRPPDGASLYPGRSTTALCPIDTFDEAPLYPDGGQPNAAEQARRLTLYWHPYHTALQAEIQRLKDAHGRVLLWDAHSIRSRVPRFFEGRLPDFNFGTNGDLSTLPGLAERLCAQVLRDGRYSAVANGRFKGGYITRQYGDPAQGIHAVQLELAQLTYMDESRPYAYDPDRASKVAPLIRQAIELALEALPRG